MTNLGNRVRKKREALGLSLSELADIAMVSKAGLHDIENKPGVRPSAHVLYRLAASLGTTMEDLLDKPPLAPQTPRQAKALVNENLNLRRRLERIRKAVAESDG